MPVGAFTTSRRCSLIVKTRFLSQRVESSIGPIMSNDIDGRWVQCEQCHKWRHWVCALYDDTQYGQNRPYYCELCKSQERKTEQV